MSLWGPIARYLLTCLGFAGSIPSARAELMEFRFEGFLVQGNINESIWFTGHVTFIAVADTSTREFFSPGGYTVRNLSTVFVLPGGASFDFLSGTRTFVNNVTGRAGLSREDEEGLNSGNDLFHTAASPVFSTWDLTSSLGPVQGTGRLLQWGPDYDAVYTTAGILRINDGTTTTRFTATVIPEPWGLGGILCFWAWGPRRRSQPSRSGLATADARRV